MRKGLLASWLVVAIASAVLLHPPVEAQRTALTDLTASPAFWRGFRPFVIAFGDGDPARAARYMRTGTKILRSVDANLDVDETTKTFQETSQKHMEKFDLRSFFKLLPEVDGPYRYFAFQGEPLEGSYRVRAVRAGIGEISATSTRRDFGAASGMFRMRQVKDDDQRYLLQWRTGVGFGEVSWASVVAGLSDAVALFDPPSQDADTPLVLQAAEIFLKRSQPQLGPEDRAVLAVLWGSFPELAQLLGRLGTADDVIHARDEHTGITHVRWVSRVNVNAFSESYPKLASYFKGLGKIAALKLRLVDGNGHKLCEISADTERMQTSLEAYVRGGRIVPTQQGVPRLDRPARFERMRAHVDLHFQAYKVHIYVNDLRIETRYEERSTGASFTAQIKETPRILVRGAAFGILPTGMLDWFIPGDMEGLARKLFDIATQGNDGQGILAQYRFERPQGGLATIDGSLGGEILDSALVRFAMAIAADRVVPDKKQMDDLRRFGVAYRDAVDADIVRFEKHGRLPRVTLPHPAPLEPTQASPAP